MNEATTIAVDLAKNVFEVPSADANRRILERRRLTRGKFRELLARHEPVEVVMEACGSARFWGRTAVGFGHRAILLPPAQVKPYVPAQQDRPHRHHGAPRGSPPPGHPGDPGQDRLVDYFASMELLSTTTFSSTTSA